MTPQRLQAPRPAPGPAPNLASSPPREPEPSAESRPAAGLTPGPKPERRPDRSRRFWELWSALRKRRPPKTSSGANEKPGPLPRPPSPHDGPGAPRPASDSARAGELARTPSTAPLFSTQGLQATDSRGELLSVPDLRLGPGDSVLVWHDDRRLLETLARLADGTAAPRTGRLRWRGRPGPNLDDLVDALNFARTVGAFNGASRLLSHFNALQNLCLEYEYHHGAFDGTARKLALERLAGLGLTELARTPQSALSSREASALALAVILARRPSLLILERPLQLLGRPLFERLWPAVAAEAAAGGQAILALDLSAEPYSSGFFQSVVALTPAVPGGPPAP